MKSIHELIEEKKALLDEARAIHTRVNEQQNGEWRGDDEAKFDSLTAAAEQIDQNIKRTAKLEAAEKSQEELEKPAGRRSEPASPNGAPRRPGQVTERDRAEAFRAWALAGTDSDLTDLQRENATRCGMDLRAKKIDIPLFAPVAMRSLREEDQRAWHQTITEERAALTGAQSTTTTGGYTTADAAMQALEVALLAFGGVRSVATIIRSATGGPMPFPTTNDTSNKGEIIAENTTYNELEMTFGQLVLDAYKYSSKYILASVEFLQDTSINVAEFIGNALGNRIGRIQNDHFTTGTGTGQPKGIVVAAASGVTGAGDPPTYDQLVDLVHSVDPAYRNNGRFMLNDATLKSLKKIKVLQYSGDTTGVPLWQPALAAGQQDTILGYPFVINQSMASPGSSAKKILFGDFSKYLIRDVRDVELRRLDERFAELGQVAFLAFARSDGDLLDAGTNPVKYLSQA